MWLALLFACAEEEDCKGGYCGETIFVAPEPLLQCDERGWETPDDPLQAFCVGCVELECSYTVLADPAVAKIEIDVAGELPDGTSWSEYHDDFVADSEGVWSLSLHRVSTLEEYVSGDTTLLPPDDDSVSFGFSASDAEGVYVDCAWAGDDGAQFGDCRAL